jgi:hypothetical protein
METRGPQSTQSVPKAHVANLEPGPPLSPTLRQSFVYSTPEECGGGGGDTLRAPQSTQSVPYAHIRSTEPGPPSKHSASDAKKHAVVQMPVPARKGDGLTAGGGGGWPGPQSAQSVPYRCSAPGLPVTEGVCSDGGEGESAPRRS